MDFPMEPPLTPPTTCSTLTPLTPQRYAPITTPESPLAPAHTRRLKPSRPPSTPHDASPSVVAGFQSPAQQQAGSAEYLARLLRLVRSDRRRASKNIMADFLASFNLGAQTPAPSNNLSCGSVQDIQLHLRGVLDSKVTPNRAEHVSVTLELKSTVRFTLVLSEPENGVLENLNNIDPSLGGSRSTSIPMDQSGGQLSRVVDAHETLMNQPQDDPALQRSVAKHIVTAISATDGSTWNVREVSRGSQGWTFTYLCKDSYRQWTRQNAKNPSKAIVGEYSDREPDPVLHNRPAFDCRGLVVIAFNRGSRSITIKYDHTPLHKTVAELAEYFKPPPRQLGPGAQRALQQKTPKKSEKKGEKRSEKKKRDSTKAQDENGNPRKRKKKNNGVAQPDPPPDGPVMPPDYPGAVPINGEAGPSYANGPQPSTNGEQSSQAFNDYPQGLMDGDASANNAPKPQQAKSSVSFPVNVSAAEAARRKEVATALLTSHGVPPETLSTEQFNIFSNQSPELQKESLNMLVKYGAERLRIVHPSNKEGSASGTTSANATPSQSSQPTPSGPTTTKELVPQSGKKATTKGSTTAGVANGGNSATPEATQTPSRSKKGQGKSRTACFSCKSRKVKCPRERPICAECLTEGLDCQYAPQKPRSRKTKSDAIVIEDDEEDEDATEENTQVEDAEEQNTTHHEAQDYSSYGQMPVADMLTPSVERPPPRETAVPLPTYFQSASGLALPQVEVTSSIQPQSLYASSYNVGASQTTHAVEQQPVQAQPQPSTKSPVQKKRSARGSAASRRSLPSGPSHNESPTMAAVNPQTASDWTAISNASVPPATTTTASPQLSQSTTARRGTRQSNKRMSTDTTYGMQQAAALSQAALYQQPQTDTHQQQANIPHGTMQPHHSPTVAAAAQAVHRTSPFQQVELPRTKSRQSQRTQTRTPNQSTSQAYQPPSNLSRQSNASATAQTSNLSGYNDYDRYSSANTTGHQSSQPAYDSYSQQRTSSAASSTRAAEKTSRNAAIARSMASQPASSMATAYPSNTSTSNQWSSGSQSHNTRSYANSTSSYNTSTSYTQPSTSATASASLQNFNMRGSSSQQPTRSDTSYNQQQPGYSGYSSQGTHQQNQSTNQHPSWYFDSANSTSSFTPANQSSGYSWKMPDNSWSNV